LTDCLVRPNHEPPDAIKFYFIVVTENRNYELAADSKGEMNTWMSVISRLSERVIEAKEETPIVAPQPIHASPPVEPQIVAPQPVIVEMLPLSSDDILSEKDDGTSANDEEDLYDIEEVSDFDHTQSMDAHEDYKTIDEALTASQRGIGVTEMSESERKYFTRFGLLPPTAYGRDAQPSIGSGSIPMYVSSEKTALLAQQQQTGSNQGATDESSCCMIL